MLSFQKYFKGNLYQGRSSAKMTATNQVSFSLWGGEEGALLAPAEEPTAHLECMCYSLWQRQVRTANIQQIFSKY